VDVPEMMSVSDALEAFEAFDSLAVPAPPSVGSPAPSAGVVVGPPHEDPAPPSVGSPAPSAGVVGPPHEAPALRVVLFDVDLHEIQVPVAAPPEPEVAVPDTPTFVAAADAKKQLRDARAFLLGPAGRFAGQAAAAKSRFEQLVQRRDRVQALRDCMRAMGAVGRCLACSCCAKWEREGRPTAVACSTRCPASERAVRAAFAALLQSHEHRFQRRKQSSRAK